MLLPLLQNNLLKSSSASYSLVAGYGLYVVSGNSATFNENLVAGFGAYSVSGQSATLGSAEAVANGAYSISGQSATLNITILCGFGVYSVSGQASTLSTQEIVGQGSYAVNGQSATLGVTIVSGNGVYAVAGQSATFNTSLITGNGVYSVLGQTATLGIKEIAGLGSYSVQGQQAGLTKNSVLSCDSGVYQVRGFLALGTIVRDGDLDYRRKPKNKKIVYRNHRDEVRLSIVRAIQQIEVAPIQEVRQVAPAIIGSSLNIEVVLSDLNRVDEILEAARALRERNDEEALLMLI